MNKLIKLWIQSGFYKQICVIMPNDENHTGTYWNNPKFTPSMMCIFWKDPIVG